MKKLVIIALILLSKVVSAQTSNLLVGNPWNSDNIRSIRNYVISFAGPAYKTVNMQTSISKSIDKAYYLFSDTSGKQLKIDIKRDLLNRNVDRGTADTLISEIKISGYYPLLLKMYRQSFNPDVNSEQIIKKGKAEPISRPDGVKKVSITFFRSDEQSGAWTLWIKLG